jgi:hypothetical protein
MSTEDPTKRAELVCEAAQRIVGPGESIFVTPKEIVNVGRFSSKIAPN